MYTFTFQSKAVSILWKDFHSGSIDHALALRAEAAAKDSRKADREAAALQT
jgi:hypothetical protein